MYCTDQIGLCLGWQSLRSKVESTIGGYFQVASFCHLFGVVEKMLVWDPDERISARTLPGQCCGVRGAFVLVFFFANFLLP